MYCLKAMWCERNEFFRILRFLSTTLVNGGVNAENVGTKCKMDVNDMVF